MGIFFTFICTSVASASDPSEYGNENPSIEHVFNLNNFYIAGFLVDNLGGNYSSINESVTVAGSNIGNYNMSSLTSSAGMGGGLRIGTWSSYFGLEAEGLIAGAGIPSQSLINPLSNKSFRTDNLSLMLDVFQLNALMRIPFVNASGDFAWFPYMGLCIGALFSSSQNTLNSSPSPTVAPGVEGGIKLGIEGEWSNGLGLFTEYRLLVGNLNLSYQEQLPYGNSTSTVGSSYSGILLLNMLDIGVAFHF